MDIEKMEKRIAILMSVRRSRISISEMIEGQDETVVTFCCRGWNWKAKFPKYGSPVVYLVA